MTSCLLQCILRIWYAKALQQLLEEDSRYEGRYDSIMISVNSFVSFRTFGLAVGRIDVFALKSCGFSSVGQTEINC